MLDSAGAVAGMITRKNFLNMGARPNGQPLPAPANGDCHSCWLHWHCVSAADYWDCHAPIGAVPTLLLRHMGVAVRCAASHIEEMSSQSAAFARFRKESQIARQSVSHRRGCSHGRCEGPRLIKVLCCCCLAARWFFGLLYLLDLLLPPPPSPAAPAAAAAAPPPLAISLLLQATVPTEPTVHHPCLLFPYSRSQ